MQDCNQAARSVAGSSRWILDSDGILRPLLSLLDSDFAGRCLAFDKTSGRYNNETGRLSYPVEIVDSSSNTPKWTFDEVSGHLSTHVKSLNKTFCLASVPVRYSSYQASFHSELPVVASECTGGDKVADGAFIWRFGPTTYGSDEDSTIRIYDTRESTSDLKVFLNYESQGGNSITVSTSVLSLSKTTDEELKNDLTSTLSIPNSATDIEITFTPLHDKNHVLYRQNITSLLSGVDYYVFFSDSDSDDAYTLETSVFNIHGPPPLSDKGAGFRIAVYSKNLEKSDVNVFGQTTGCLECSKPKLDLSDELNIGLNRLPFRYFEINGDYSYNLTVNAQSGMTIFENKILNFMNGGRYTLLIGPNNTVSTLVDRPPTDTGFIITVNIGWMLAYCILLAIFMGECSKTPGEENVSVAKKRSRVQALDAFRGLSLCIMLFANYGGGKVAIFDHSPWNGLTIADLVFPWFTWIMGASIALSHKSLAKRNFTVNEVVQKIFYRTFVLLSLGILLQGPIEWSNIRIPGVLQYLAIGYFFVNLIVLLVPKWDIEVGSLYWIWRNPDNISDDGFTLFRDIRVPFAENNVDGRGANYNEAEEGEDVLEKYDIDRIVDDLSTSSSLLLFAQEEENIRDGVGMDDGYGVYDGLSPEDTSKSKTEILYEGCLPMFRDICPRWIEWVIALVFPACYICIQFFLPVPGCPTGYVGPGGVYSEFPDCTGGAHRYIDWLVFGYKHLYQSPNCGHVYGCGPYDPEGLLGGFNVVFLCFLGLQAGRIILAYPDHSSRLTRFLLWGVGLCGIAATLSGLDNRGIIPVCKEVWSTSFILLLAGWAFILLAFFYFLIDVVKVWTGMPLQAVGMNSILVYIGSEHFQDLPTPFGKGKDIATAFSSDIFLVCIWITIACVLHKNRLFFKI
eukprot:g134.t1